MSHCCTPKYGFGFQPTFESFLQGQGDFMAFNFQDQNFGSCREVKRIPSQSKLLKSKMVSCFFSRYYHANKYTLSPGLVLESCFVQDGKFSREEEYYLVVSNSDRDKDLEVNRSFGYSCLVL